MYLKTENDLSGLKMLIRGTLLVKKNVLLIFSFLSLSTQIAFSSDKKIKLSNTPYKNSDQNNVQSIKIDHFAGHIAVDLAWVWFCKRPCNKKLFNNVILPEGHNIFHAARTTGDILDTPYMQTDKLYHNKTEDIRCTAIKGMMKIRDEAIFLGGKYFQGSRYILSGSCVALSSIIESEVLKKKTINNFFKLQNLPEPKIKNNDNSIDKYAKTKHHIKTLELLPGDLNISTSIARINIDNHIDTKHNFKPLL